VAKVDQEIPQIQVLVFIKFNEFDEIANTMPFSAWHHGLLACNTTVKPGDMMQGAGALSGAIRNTFYVNGFAEANGRYCGSLYKQLVL
jgi:hypothetical protein